MDRQGTGSGRFAGVLLVTMLGCVPPLRIVHRDASDVGDASDASDLGEVGDVADASDGGDAVDALDESDVGDAVDVMDVVDVTDAVDVTDVTDVTDAVDVIDASDVADVTDAVVCGAGLTACGGTCVDTQRDLRHCGTCGAVCAPANASASCTAGVCSYGLCTTGYADCDGVVASGCEVELRSSVDHCGSCGNACRYVHATPRCAGGSCAIAACDTGYGNCDGTTTNGCETDTRTSLAHCGACGHACATGQACIAGACVEVQQSCVATGTPGCGLVMVPGATFTLGGTQFGADAQPGTQVSTFYMDRYEVSMGRFRSFWEAGHPAPPTSVRYPGGVDSAVTGTINTIAELTSDPACNWRWGSARDAHPMNCVNWYTAMAFCVWDGSRLPTQAEWELAASGTDGRTVPWRSTAPPAPEVTWRDLEAHTCVSSKFGPIRTSTCPVDFFDADVGPSGVIGLYGNVIEWVGDRGAVYGHSGSGCWPGMGQRDPVCLTSSIPWRVTRGGTIWGTTADEINSVLEVNAYNPTGLSSVNGFRCARSR